MRMFLLSLLAIGCTQAFTVGSPYSSAYWTYNPARGEFPVGRSVSQGYLRYFDNSGNERLVTYNYPEPLYGVRQLSYVSGGQSSSSPVFGAFGQDDSIEFAKAREAHFRAWALQQYQALKCEMDAIRAEGKEPSADMYLKFQPLQKIALTADYTTISDIPEVKQIREDHLRIWNEALNKNLQVDTGRSTYQQSIVNDNQGEFKTYYGQPSSTLATVEGTPEQKQAHDESLRIHSEQIAHLRQLELQHQQQFQQKQAEQHAEQQAEALAEFERAKQEHLRLWNEAKLRAEQPSFNIHGVAGTTNKENERAAKEQISALKYDQIAHHQEELNKKAAEIQKAHEEHLRLVSEATQSIHGAEGHNKEIEQTIGNQQVLDTPEVIRAREEHLRLVNEAKLRAEIAEQQELKHKQQPIQYIGQQSKYLPAKIEATAKNYEAAGTEPISESKDISNIAQQHHTYQTDFQKSRDDHIRLVNEATNKIKAAEEHIKQLEAQQQSSTKSHIHQEHYQQQSSSQSSETHHNIEETPEVKRAREEHLRIFNTVKSQNEQEEAKLTEMKSSGIISKPLTNDEELEKIKEEERLKEETRLLELQGLREAERLQEEYRQSELERIREAERLAGEQEKIKAELKILKTEDDNQLRLDKLQEQDELKKLQQLDSEDNKQTEIQDAVPLIQPEARHIGLEELREAERLQEQYRQMELERMREAKRLAEEQQQIEAELKLVKIEDENRFQMEKLQEERRLKQEQEELQKQQQLDTEEQKGAHPITKSFEQIHAQQHKYANNPYLRAYPIKSHGQQFLYSNNPFLKASLYQTPIVYYPVPITPNNVPVQTTNIPVARYIQSSQHLNTGSKQQHLKDDFKLNKFSNSASTQPADTAVALGALQRANNEHFRAHEQALQQLRWARLQNPDCN